MKVERPRPADGQAPRITELWAWTAIDPMTDTEGIVSARLPGIGVVPLVTSMRTLADRMEPHAKETARAAQEPRPVVQLRHFVAVEDDQ